MFKAYNVYFDRILESMASRPFQDESMDFITFKIPTGAESWEYMLS